MKAKRIPESGVLVRIPLLSDVCASVYVVPGQYVVNQSCSFITLTVSQLSHRYCMVSPSPSLRPLLTGINRLWPYHVTQQKVARSWATQVDLMERYPEHRFSCSQAQQFKWLEQASHLFVALTSSNIMYSCTRLCTKRSRRRFWTADSSLLVAPG